MPEDSGAETSRVLLWIGLALLVVLLFGFPFWGWSDDGWEFFGGVFMMMMLMPFLLVILIVILVVAIANNSSRRNAPPPAVAAPAAAQAPRPGTDKEALAILERRYASGEVTRAEYLRMRDDLR